MRIVFIGTGEIGLPTLRFLHESREHQLVGVVTQPDKPVGRSQQLQAPPIKLAVAGSATPVFQPARLRAEEAVGQLRGLAPEVIVVMAYGQILPRSVLEIPSIACLNLHASLLPKYRGAAPIQATILNGDNESGLTIIYMNEGLDTGDLLLQKKLPISPQETGGSLHDRLAALGPEALEAALQLLSAARAPRVPQDSAQASYAPKLTREDGQIDWSEAGAAIERKIRAFDPWPGTFTRFTDSAGKTRQLKIFRAALVPGSSAEPGKITQPNESEILVATGDGSLRLQEIQLEGKRRLRASDFLRGFSSPSAFF